jgi:hypothetical protein
MDPNFDLSGHSVSILSPSCIDQVTARMNILCNGIVVELDIFTGKLSVG